MIATLKLPNLRRRSVVLSLLGASLAHAETPAARRTVSWKLLDGEPALRAWWQDPAAGGKPKAHLLVLHGSGEVGDDMQAPLRNGVDSFMDRAAALGYAVCVPQLEADRKDWDIPRLHALAQKLAPQGLPLQVVGISMGGFAIWNWLWLHAPDLNAAVPMCAGGPPRSGCPSRRVPVRAYHGALDDVVPVAWQQSQVDAHRACGAEVEFIVYPDANHGVWIPAFQDAAMLPWLQARLGKA